MTQRGKAYNIAIIGILGALIILQAYIPMVGYARAFFRLGLRFQRFI